MNAWVATHVFPTIYTLSHNTLQLAGTIQSSTFSSQMGNLRLKEAEEALRQITELISTNQQSLVSQKETGQNFSDVKH